MSKIAELLKLAEQKKEDKPKLEIIVPAFTSLQDDVSKSKYDGISVSKTNVEQVGVSRVNYEQPEISADEAQDVITTKTVETSPMRDFTKVSNSIMKRAIPEKYFRGLSKHTYDVLYQRTRGAVKPLRTIQLTKDELVRLTGLSKEAVKLHIKYLKEIGLLDSRPAIGSHAGWEYEIFVPEEIEDDEQVGVRLGKVSRGKRGQNLPLHTVQNLPLLTHTNLVENKDTYEFPNTSFKTNTKNDDDKRRAALSQLAEKLDEASKKITGKGLSQRETEKWGRLAELLVLELEVAARRADGISSVPAFLTEVLRRQFFASRQHQSFSAKPSKRKIDTVGKSESGSYEIKPLDAKGRQAALDQLREFADEDFLQDFKKWYTSPDWDWLIKQLEK